MVVKLLKWLLTQFANWTGYDLVKVSKSPNFSYEGIEDISDRSIHYACGKNFKEGWLNVDYLNQTGRAEVLLVDLIARHPFKNNFFEWGFCEDFLEHLSQPQSILFLAEVFRTFQAGGICRFSFPGWDRQTPYFPPMHD